STWLSPAVQPGPSVAIPRGALPELLTQREADVLRLLAAGRSNKEIAAALIIGEETVKTHVARILRKLDATTRTEAAARGKALGLI
ncbi:MAG TPA: LuxR C-terminal-related transcriptional regulator, partial [Symbiobacteriaceae bacterium]|nr:LuxR C-terminal-related transcriptional regulator [Symbiobacteriaceae bacterium]